MPPYQLPNLVRATTLLTRSGSDDDNARLDDANTDDRNHRRVEIGVIVAIVVAGLAIIGFIATFIIKQRRRQIKRAAKRAAQAGQEGQEITWYGPGEEPHTTKITVAPQEDGYVGMKAKPVKKVGFIGEAVGEAPPDYQTAVTGKKGDEETK